MTVLNKNAIMAHAIMGYPNKVKSFELVEMFIDKGVEYLELQIPFSHPTADGATLNHANLVALENGADLEYCFDFLFRIRSKYPNQKIMLMSYFNKIYSFGIDAFIKQMQDVGIQYFILPDLPFDAPEAMAFINAENINLVPVIAPNLSKPRLGKIVKLQAEYIYLMSNYQVTGSNLVIHANVAELISILKNKTNTKVGIGFGISNNEDVKTTLKVADFAIVGSTLKNAIDCNTIETKLNDLLVG